MGPGLNACKIASYFGTKIAKVSSFKGVPDRSLIWDAVLLQSASQCCENISKGTVKSWREVFEISDTS